MIKKMKKNIPFDETLTSPVYLIQIMKRKKRKHIKSLILRITDSI